MAAADKLYILGDGHRKTATIAFTLPISCQICLGKVKHPVCCKNHHVFCKTCLQIWTSKTKHCPSCRVPFNEECSFSELLGGHSLDVDDDQATFSKPEIRKARVKSLFTSYEEEIEKLLERNAQLLDENQTLKSSPRPLEDSEQKENLVQLHEKLEEASQLHDRLKSDLNQYKKENDLLKMENLHLKRENENLKYSNSQRSPKKFGRITVATLESQIDKYKKDIQSLEMALHRSDEVIKELQSRPHLKNPKVPKASCLSASLGHLDDMRRPKVVTLNRPASAGATQDLVRLNDTDQSPITIRRNLGDWYSDCSENHIAKPLTSSVEAPVPPENSLRGSEHQKLPNFPEKLDAMGSRDSLKKPSLELVQRLARHQLEQNLDFERSPVSALLSDRSARTETGSTSSSPTTAQQTPPRRKINSDGTSMFLEIPSPSTPSNKFKRLAIHPEEGQSSPNKRSREGKSDKMEASNPRQQHVLYNPAVSLSYRSQLMNREKADNGADDTLTREFNECIDLLTEAENRSRSSQGIHVEVRQTEQSSMDSSESRRFTCSLND